MIVSVSLFTAAVLLFWWAVVEDTRDRRAASGVLLVLGFTALIVGWFLLYPRIPVG